MMKFIHTHSFIIVTMLLLPTILLADNSRSGPGTEPLNSISKKESNINYFQVQILITISRDKAMTNMAKLILAGFLDARFEPFKGPNKKVYYKVIAGDFLDKREAVAARNRINQYPENYKSFIIKK